MLSVPGGDFESRNFVNGTRVKAVICPSGLRGAWLCSDASALRIHGLHTLWMALPDCFPTPRCSPSRPPFLASSKLLKKQGPFTAVFLGHKMGHATKGSWSLVWAAPPACADPPSHACCPGSVGRRSVSGGTQLVPWPCLLPVEGPRLYWLHLQLS